MLLLAQTIPDLLLHNAWKAAILTAYVTVLNFAHSPRTKTLIFAMPVPFTCAFLASGIKINPTHMTGIVLGSLYHWTVLVMYLRWRVPLLATIVVSATLYVLASMLIRPLSDVPFLYVIFPVLGLWALGFNLYKPIAQPGYRSPTPWWIKAPAIFTIGMCIYLLTGLMGGAVTTFPYAGVFTSYEMRQSLRTLAGQFTINNLSGWFMFIAMWLVQDHMSPIATLCVGWSVLICVLAVIYRLKLGRPKDPEPATVPPVGIGATARAADA